MLKSRGAFLIYKTKMGLAQGPANSSPKRLVPEGEEFDELVLTGPGLNPLQSSRQIDLGTNQIFVQY